MISVLVKRGIVASQENLTKVPLIIIARLQTDTTLDAIDIFDVVLWVNLEPVVTEEELKARQVVQFGTVKEIARPYRCS